ncbi:MAG: HAMP domain-containing sensor histidine kinase [Erysipelotrichaceae bacterium]|nr:HAMP domain-containing sensor histidine kinase [Erysipelotrichaceae bacterium]
MRRLQNWLGGLSLTQQLLSIIFASSVVFILLFFVYLKGNIEEFSHWQTFVLLERSQDEIVEIYKDHLIYSEVVSDYTRDISHLFIKDQEVEAFVGTYLRGTPLLKIVKEKMPFTDDTMESTMMIEGERVFYKVRVIDAKTIVISFMGDSYSRAIANNLFNSISNLAALVVGTIYLLLVLWVSFLLHPLNQIRTYIERIRNGEPAELKIDRNDEIGEVAFALVNMREELRHQDEVKEEMIHNISHDLKTPIATIKSYGESIKDGIYPYETLEKSVDVIIENADRLEKKVHSLLFLNRLDYLLSSNEMEMKDIQMKEIVEVVLLSLKVIRPEIQMTVDLEPTIFRGNEESWRVLVENLVDNALRYAESNITITLRNGYFSVANDGPSLSQERMEKLFKPFEKGSKGKFGLGLSICYKIVTAYGYTIEAQNLEKGVIFKVKDKTEPKTVRKKKIKK